MLFIFLVVLSNFECCSDNNVRKIWVHAILYFQLLFVELTDLIHSSPFTNVNLFLTNSYKALILGTWFCWASSNSNSNCGPFRLNNFITVIKSGFLSE